MTDPRARAGAFTVDALWPGFQCIRCSRRAVREGSGRRFYAGSHQLVCARCKGEIDRRRKT